MDTPKTVTHVSLCAGYGGIDLGLKRAISGLRTIAFSEIEAFACANLVAKMEAGLLDPAPIWSNLKTFPWRHFRDRVGILSSGYPCQPFSSAGKRLGQDDPRHLWPFIADGIRFMRPQLCFFENVEGHISLGLREVIEELGRLGYRSSWGIFSAAEVGAPHQRKRVFILAHRDDGRRWQDWMPTQLWTSGLEVGSSMAHSNGHGNIGSRNELGVVGEIGQRRQDLATNCISQHWPVGPTQLQWEWEPPRVVGNASDFSGTRQTNGQRQITPRGTSAAWNDGQTEPTMGGDADGPAGGLGYAKLCVSSDNRTDELRALGNGVVPATAERAFRVLTKRLATE